MDPLRDAARRDEFGPAVEGRSAVDGRRVSWIWSELDAGADAAALRLAEAGVGPGDGVATLLPPSPEAILLLHAVPRAGGVVLPLNPSSTAGELERALASLGRPRLLLAPGPVVSGLRRDFPQLGTVAVEDICPVWAADAESLDSLDPGLRPAIPELTGDTPIAVLLTSGSTGAPTPVPLTHGNLMASARGAAARLRLDPLDTWFASLSPAHVGGLVLLHRAAVVGCPLVTRPRFSADEFLALADAGEITHGSLVPTMLHRLLELRGEADAPRALRCVLLGGAPTPRSLLEQAIRHRWPVALTYGLTEASSQVATAPPEAVRRKPGSPGRPLPEVGVAIRSRKEGGVGEILVRGPTVAPLAPWGRGTDVSTRPSVFVDEAGWLHTGDLGRIDEDGDLWITGRVTERIVTGGVTVEPMEVEAALSEHPQVAEAGVTAVPDSEWGERIVALVVPVEPAAPPAPESLLAHAKAHLGSARRPREIGFVDALPRTRTGKLDRRALARQAEEVQLFRSTR